MKGLCKFWCYCQFNLTTKVQRIIKSQSPQQSTGISVGWSRSILADNPGNPPWTHCTVELRFTKLKTMQPAVVGNHVFVPTSHCGLNPGHDRRDCSQVNLSQLLVQWLVTLTGHISTNYTTLTGQISSTYTTVTGHISSTHIMLTGQISSTYTCLLYTSPSPRDS